MQIFAQIFGTYTCTNSCIMWHVYIALIWFKFNTLMKELRMMWYAKIFQVWRKYQGYDFTNGRHLKQITLNSNDNLLLISPRLRPFLNLALLQKYLSFGPVQLGKVP